MNAQRCSSSPSCDYSAGLVRSSCYLPLWKREEGLTGAELVGILPHQAEEQDVGCPPTVTTDPNSTLRSPTRQTCQVVQARSELLASSPLSHTSSLGSASILPSIRNRSRELRVSSLARTTTLLRPACARSTCKPVLCSTYSQL